VLPPENARLIFAFSRHSSQPYCDEDVNFGSLVQVVNVNIVLFIKLGRDEDLHVFLFLSRVMVFMSFKACSMVEFTYLEAMLFMWQ
jgi:hypothetical protein